MNQTKDQQGKKCECHCHRNPHKCYVGCMGIAKEGINPCEHCKPSQQEKQCKCCLDCGGKIENNHCNHCKTKSSYFLNTEPCGKPDCPCIVHCQNDCHHQKPYGFVPMADCPVHDGPPKPQEPVAEPQKERDPHLDTHVQYSVMENPNSWSDKAQKKTEDWVKKLNMVLFDNIDLDNPDSRPVRKELGQHLENFISTLLQEEREGAVQIIDEMVVKHNNEVLEKNCNVCDKFCCTCELCDCCTVFNAKETRFKILNPNKL